VTDRRTVIADAAITTIAREGMRGFTHRAVDRTAGLAEGSTSYYFRTRDALTSAAVARLAELDVLDVGDIPDRATTLDLEALTTQVTALVVLWLTDGRDRTLARYELSLESTRRPELRGRMRTHGMTFRRMAERTFAAHGARDAEQRAHAFLASLDGLMMYQLTRGEFDEDGLRSACSDLLSTALT
jgi:DNA-binding transcriptional regulator YbjK